MLLLIIVAAVAAFFFGYRYGDGADTIESPAGVIGTTGETVDVDRARQAGAKVGEKVAEGANQVERAASDAALTAKIKSKMALDDSVDALDIDVDTTNGVVTLSGSADSEISRTRAVQLAKETEGVLSVVDRLTVE
ncbi:MAG TPA: BON domain-containing protein [Burkholderiales bacterium]|nr:BON domain-containing protein [Burkholderiales bacterium]